jgi:hypothetical protein
MTLWTEFPPKGTGLGGTAAERLTAATETFGTSGAVAAPASGDICAQSVAHPGAHAGTARLLAAALDKGDGWAAPCFCAMELITILNRCHHFWAFVYQYARFSADKKSIEVAVRSRKGY